MHNTCVNTVIANAVETSSSVWKYSQTHEGTKLMKGTQKQ